MQRRGFLGALAALSWGNLADGAGSGELFRIERSKNRNVVVYRAQGSPRGLSAAAPVSAYWLMLAEDGRREELTWAERRLAYGFEVSDVTPDRCRLTLQACSRRVLSVERVDGTFRAFCRVAGERASLERIFVQTRESGLLPSVQYVDLFGKGRGGATLRERLHEA
jgi:Domain of unknown function (DUF4833)